ncbi:hypothetical protein DSO57_1034414 [Entomophthora muscae]|uniref:Uncharacterized protein n=1 Tax=Entomophthora muscae TaxID=34485 RepID=A0ACC2UA96_9FUNG|nr:hypothetical protein DSO57_1034414 [Entomophthora muscae]
MGRIPIIKCLYFMKNENIRLRTIGQMPPELIRIIKNCTTENDKLYQFAYLLTDITNGYLGLVVGQECYIQRLGPLSSPHTFKIEDSADVPCMAFLPSATSNSPPGLVSCTSSGSIQFWDNVQWATSSSSSPNHYLKSKIELDEADPVKFLVACGALGFAVGTQKRLYFVSPTQGKFQHYTLSRHHTWSLLSFIRRHTVPDHDIDLISACYSDTVPLIYALTPTSLLAWQLVAQDPSFVQEWFLVPHLPAIEAKLQSFDLEFIEIVATTQGVLALLVQTLPSRETAIVLLKAPKPDTPLELIDIIRLDSSETEVVKVFTVPYIGLGQDAAVVVQFPSRMVLVALGLGNQQILIPIAKDRQLLEVHDVEGTCSSMLAGPDAGLLKFVINPPSALGAHLSNSNPLYGPYQSLKNTVKSALDQIDLESKPQLPTFFVGRDSSVLLNGVVIEMVDEIMSHKQAGNTVLETILEGRRMRLLNLTLLLSVNKLISQISADARHYLASSSQKVEGASALYLHYLHRLSEKDDTVASRLLISAMQTLYLQYDSTDFVTTFFHHDVQRLPDLLVLIGQRVSIPESILRSSFSSYGALMFEANTILLKTMEACKSYTLKYSPILQLDDPPETEPWITQVMVEMLATSFLGTVRLLEASPVHLLPPPNTKLDADWARTVDLQEVTIHTRLNARALRIHLGGLGEHLLWLMHYRPNQQNEHQRELVDKIFTTLVHYQMGNEALLLAERHRDFRSLARLVFDIYPDLAAHHAKADVYAEQYSDEFIYALLSHYAEANRFSCILGRGESWPDQVTQFLSDPKYQHIAWLDDLRHQRFKTASLKLTSNSTYQNRILSGKIFLSISKLALFAHEDVPKDMVELIDGQLIITNIHHVLSQSARVILKGSAHQPAASDLNLLLPNSVIESVPLQTEHFVASIQILMDGHLLDIESLADVLTLKYDWDLGFNGCFEMAMDACRHLGRDSGEDFNYAVRTIWRRVLLSDDWAAIDGFNRENNGLCMPKLQDTALYTTLTHVIEKGFSDRLILSPTECLFDSSPQYLSSRFPRLFATQVPKLLDEYYTENNQLELLISKHRMNSLYSEVYHMAISDVGAFLN